MDPNMINFMKLNSKIFRNTHMYLDKALKQYEISSGTFPYLFMLEHNEGINQNRISREIGNDKAMSARTITKLIEQGYVSKKEDARDSRAYKLYLTPQAREVIPAIRKEINSLIDLITADLSEEEKNITMRSLAKIFEKTQKLKECEKE